MCYKRLLQVLLGFWGFDLQVLLPFFDANLQVLLGFSKENLQVLLNCKLLRINIFSLKF